VGFLLLLVKNPKKPTLEWVFLGFLDGFFFKNPPGFFWVGGRVDSSA